MKRPDKVTAGYALSLLVCWIIAALASWTPLGIQLSNSAHDFLFRLRPPEALRIHSLLLVFDDRTIQSTGGMRRLRDTLATGLELIAVGGPRVVVVDITLAEADEEKVDSRLYAVFRKLPNLILPCDIVGGGWQDPLPRFRKTAAAVGHVHADPDPYDSITRQIPLQKVSGGERRWALALEAFRLSRGASHILESPHELEVAGKVIPTGRDPIRPLRVRYLQPKDGKSQIPALSIQELKEKPELAQLASGKVVFVGVTSPTAVQDRLMTPYSFGQSMPGVEIHAQAFETLARGEFLTSASEVWVLLFSAGLAAGAGLIFRYLPGWPAYSVAVAILMLVHLFPYWLFRANILFPYFAPAATAWLSMAVAASYQHFVVRRLLRRTQMEKSRYQQAIHFVTHEMRTPLTAIQGSSELMTRFPLTEDKRKQLIEMIHSESKRLAKMIQTFLDVERLTEGQLELKRSDFSTRELVDTCVARAVPLAERKQMRIEIERAEDALLHGDRELMEYALYNLLNNAVKYSPAGTTVKVNAWQDGGGVHIAVRDQGIGMDEKELRNIFKKFYRTKRAEASGEVGTGIGLSLVEQIVTHHGGRVEVTSRPGEGSCFTLVVPAPDASAVKVE